MRSKRERANRATVWHCRAMYRNASLHHKPGSLLWNSRLEDGGDLSEGLPTYLTFFSSHFFANHDSISQNMLTFSKHSYEKRTDFRQLSGISRNSGKTSWKFRRKMTIFIFILTNCAELRKNSPNFCDTIISYREKEIDLRENNTSTVHVPLQILLK